jgi:hypothetical protein
LVDVFGHFDPIHGQSPWIDGWLGSASKARGGGSAYLQQFHDRPSIPRASVGRRAAPAPPAGRVRGVSTLLRVESRTVKRVEEHGVGRVWGGRFSLIDVCPATNGRIKVVRWADSGRSAGQALWV